MTVRLYIHSTRKRAETVALLDSGATENFMNLKYATGMGLPIKRLPSPRRLLNVDGSANRMGRLKFYVDLKARTGSKNVLMRFFLSDLGDNHVILGYPWFAAFQPNIDWAKGWIDASHLPIILTVPTAIPIKKLDEQPLMIAFVTIASADDRQTIASKLAQKNAPTITQIPSEYKRHQQVFSEEASQRFPGSRIWDHAIKLKDDAPASLPGKIYPLNPMEREELAKFVKQHLAKGYIRPSKSPYAAPFFFIKKKDGKLRPVQDYRRLNQWTIRNKYPLPLIPQLINRTRGRTLFTKFDVRWGYNNVRIKEGDEWKAAFVTNEGLFEPLVMFFGLTNSPATFQMMMNAIFEEEIRAGWLTIYMDDMLIATTFDIALHRTRVHQVLDKLHQHDLFLKPEKCAFEQTRMEFLGVVLENNTIQMDPSKVKGVADWPRPQTVTDVRSFLGFTGFYRYFIPGYSSIARPLLNLTKKATVWSWDEPEKKAFEMLKTLMCERPVLTQPNYDKPFILHMDASSYGVGAILSQRGESQTNPTKPKFHPIAYYSSTFSPTERNYDIYERELLAVLKALIHWRAHLGWTKYPIQLLTDHANLTYWKQPHKVNRRVARWYGELQDYWLEIHHIPGKTHPADMLSRPPNTDKGEEDNQEVVVLPPTAFVNNTVTLPDFETSIRMAQKSHQSTIEQWMKTTPILPPSIRSPWWTLDNKIVIPPTVYLRRQLLRLFHDAPTAGHPGRDETQRKVQERYWWPGMNTWISDYVAGCAICQQNKNLTHPLKIPLFRIPTQEDATPFSQVAFDLITQLPESNGHDAVFTIVDHGCSRAALFIPCKTAISGTRLAQLYLEHIYVWFGAPKKIISDRDPRFTSHFAKALAKRLGTTQNISTAFHPRTDGASERANQWLEQYIRLVAGEAQDDWSHWLPVASAVFNQKRNATLGMSPTQAIMGFQPSLLPSKTPSSNIPDVERRLTRMREFRDAALRAINRLTTNPPSLSIKKGDNVWLESTNLPLTTGTRKLTPRRQGPFRVIKQVTPVTYKLDLPPSWNVHDVFHASLLRPYRETEAHGPNFYRPPPDLIEGQEHLEVETILSHRRIGRRKALQYLIKWKGYPTADNSWESVNDVFAPDLVTIYHRKHPLDSLKRPAVATLSTESSPIPLKQSLPCPPLTLPPIQSTLPLVRLPPLCFRPFRDPPLLARSEPSSKPIPTSPTTSSETWLPVSSKSRPSASVPTRLNSTPTRTSLRSYTYRTPIYPPNSTSTMTPRRTVPTALKRTTAALRTFTSHPRMGCQPKRATSSATMPSPIEPGELMDARTPLSTPPRSSPPLVLTPTTSLT